MVLILILPLEHETLLVVGIVRPSVKPVVRSRSIDPIVETAPHLAFSLLFEPAKHHARINVAIPRTRQECNGATGGRLNPVNQPNRVGKCGHLRRYASTVTTLAKTKPIVNAPSVGAVRLPPRPDPHHFSDQRLHLDPGPTRQPTALHDRGPRRFHDSDQSALPEPGTAVFLGTGVLLLALAGGVAMRRRKHS